MTPHPTKPGRKETLRRLVTDLSDRGAWNRAARRRRLRVAIVTMGSSGTCREQFAPLLRHRGRIRDQLGVVFRAAWVDHESGCLPRWVADAQVVLLQVNHFIELGKGLRLLETLRRSCPGSPILYYDGDDDAGVAWPEVACACDLVVKNQLYRDRSWYLREFIGKCNLTDHVARNHGISFADDPYPHSRPMPATALDKLWLGWNLACSGVVQRFPQANRPHSSRPVDVVLRANIPQGWLAPLRTAAVEALRPLAARHRVVLPDHRVDHAAYCAELLSSRICLSPFGNGEICFRDFEAVRAGCLLVKPDVSHLETQPDVFRDGETCAAVRWDWADLAEVVERHLSDPARTARMVDEAGRRMESHLRGDSVVANFADQLRKVGAQLPALT
ncbi:MAG: hypothetical protein RL148_3267 [Planctomycetota bacterium]|jgi:hypothetical protein